MLGLLGETRNFERQTGGENTKACLKTLHKEAVKGASNLGKPNTVTRAEAIQTV